MPAVVTQSVFYQAGPFRSLNLLHRDSMIAVPLSNDGDKATTISIVDLKDPCPSECNLDSDLATLPISIDCKGARDNLPKKSKHRSFYYGSYVLVVFIHNTCFISVTMVKGENEWMSWFDIKIAASIVIARWLTRSITHMSHQRRPSYEYEERKITDLAPYTRSSDENDGRLPVSQSKYRIANLKQTIMNE